MPIGFKNFPAIFQRIMNYEPGDYLYKGCLVYMDDIVIYGKTLEKHNQRLKTILSKLNNKNLEINLEKMQVMKNEIKLLGMIINGKTVSMPDEKRQNIFTFGIPRTKKDLQNFLDTIIYHRRFIEDFGLKTEQFYLNFLRKTSLCVIGQKNIQLFLKTYKKKQIKR